MLNALLMLLASTAVGNAAQVPWIVRDDYPAALQPEQAATVEFELTYNSDGRVTGCTIRKSSGAALLDATTCRVSVRRARAKSGEPRVQSYKHSWLAPTAR